MDRAGWGLAARSLNRLGSRDGEEQAPELGAAGLLTKAIDFGLLRGEIDQRLEQAA